MLVCAFCWVSFILFAYLFVCVWCETRYERASFLKQSRASTCKSIIMKCIRLLHLIRVRCGEYIYTYINIHQALYIHTFIHTQFNQVENAKEKKKVCKMKCKRRKKCTSKDIRSGKKTRLKMKLFNPVHTYERDNHANVNFRLEQIYFKSFLHTHTTLYARTCFVKFQQAILPRCHDPVTCALLLANQ